MKRFKDLAFFVIVIAAGFALGKFGLYLYAEYTDPENKPLSLDETLGPKKSLTEEEQKKFEEYKNLALAYIYQGDLEKSIENAKHMQQLNPWDLSGYISYANTALDYYAIFNKQKVIKSISDDELSKCIKICIALAPENPEVIKLQAKKHLVLARIAQQTKNTEKTKEHFELAHSFVDMAMAQEGASFEFSLSKINLYLMMDNYDEALKLIDIKINDKEAKNYKVKLHIAQALAHQGKKNTQEEYKAYTAALQLEGISPAAQYVVLGRRAIFFDRENNLPAARADLLAMQELQPNNNELEEQIKKIEKRINKMDGGS